MDLTAYTNEQLDALQGEVVTERLRRNRLETIPLQVAQLNNDYLTADGQVSGGEWAQPEGAHDAYPLGWQTTIGGEKWESLTPANVWKPPTNWRQVTEPGKAPPDFAQPTGAGDAYGVGDEVTFQGVPYRSLIAANVWSPANYPAGWERID